MSKESLKKYYEKNKSALIYKNGARQKALRLADPEKFRAMARDRYWKNRDECVAYHTAYRAKNGDRLRKLAMESYYRSKETTPIETLRKRWSEIKRREYKNPEIRMARRLRLKIWKVLRGISKAQSTFVMLGCDIRTFMKHLESLWGPGMSWTNYGCGYKMWNVDHVKPCAAFDLSIPDDQMICFHYSNLRPVWHKENISKGSLWNGIRHRYVKKPKV